MRLATFRLPPAMLEWLPSLPVGLFRSEKQQVKGVSQIKLLVRKLLTVFARRA